MTSELNWLERAFSNILKYLPNAEEALVVKPPVLVVASLHLLVDAESRPNAATIQATTESVRQCIAQHLQWLGIPGTAHAVVTVRQARVAADERFVLRVNGQRLRCARVEMQDIVREAANRQASGGPEDQMPSIAAEFCASALQQRLSVLLKDDACDDLLSELEISDQQRAGAKNAMLVCLDHGVSLENRDGVAAILRGAPADEISMAETLIDELRPQTLDLLFSSKTLRRATLQQPNDVDLFTELRAGLFADLGILAPDFRFVMDDTLPDETVAFRLNSVMTRSWVIPDVGPLTFARQRLLHVIRSHAEWFISMSAIEARLSPLRWAMPDTVGGARERCPTAWQSALARAMLAERMTLKNIPTLLDRLLDLDPEPQVIGNIRMREGPTDVALTGTIAQLPTPAVAVSLLRQRQFEGTVRMQSESPVSEVRQLDAELESNLARSIGDGDPSEPLEIVAATVRGWYDEEHQIPLLVQSPVVRAWLHGQLKAEFPEIQVFAATEIPLGVLATAVRA